MGIIHWAYCTVPFCLIMYNVFVLYSSRAVSGFKKGGLKNYIRAKHEKKFPPPHPPVIL